MEENVRVGVIRWDSYTDSDLYYSYYGAKALSPRHHRNKVPFFGNILDGERVVFPRYTEDVFEKEMEYAVSAGIDYFIWFFYPAKGIKDEFDRTSLTVDPFGYLCSELDVVRRIYRKSKNKRGVNMCLQLSSAPLTDEEIQEICEDMQEEWYEKIEGRPLLFLYDSRSEAAQLTLKKLLKFAEDKGMKKPLLISQKLDMPSDIPVDAYGAYSMPSSLRPMTDFSEYTEMVVDRNKAILKKGRMAVPHLSFGWDPTPRIENRVPWYTYPEIDYPAAPKGDDILEQAKRLKALAVSSDAFFGHYNVFAWNEFEEGAWICPTLKDGGGTDCSHLQMLKDAICYLKE